VRDSRKGFFTFDGQFLFVCAMSILLVPFQWVTGWICAAIIHEFGHALALKLFKIKIFGINIGINGAKIMTEPIPCIQEAVCTLAGPVAGLCTLFIAKHTPHITLCGLIQSCFNLIPVYPLDGGRALRCFMQCILSDSIACKVSTWISGTVIAMFVGVGTWFSFTYTLGVLPILFPSAPLLLAIWKNSLQSGKKNSTIRERKN